MNRIRIMDNDEFKIVGLNDLKFEIGYYRTADHRFHGVNMMLNDNSFNNHLQEMTTELFINKFDIHPDDAEWLKNKIVNMNIMKDERILIDNVEISIFHNARSYCIYIQYGWNDRTHKNDISIKTDFYPILDVVFYWAAEKIVRSNADIESKRVTFRALKRLIKMHNCDPNIDELEQEIEKWERED